MIDDSAANKAIGLLRSSHYFYRYHRKIFDAMLISIEKSDPIDTVSVSNELKEKLLKSMGGLYYLTGLVEEVSLQQILDICIY